MTCALRFGDPDNTFGNKSPRRNGTNQVRKESCVENMCAVGHTNKLGLTTDILDFIVVCVQKSGEWQGGTQF